MQGWLESLSASHPGLKHDIFLMFERHAFIFSKLLSCIFQGSSCLVCRQLSNPHHPPHHPPILRMHTCVSSTSIFLKLFCGGRLSEQEESGPDRLCRTVSGDVDGAQLGRLACFNYSSYYCTPLIFIVAVGDLSPRSLLCLTSLWG